MPWSLLEGYVKTVAGRGGSHAATKLKLMPGVRKILGRSLKPDKCQSRSQTKRPTTKK